MKQYKTFNKSSRAQKGSLPGFVESRLLRNQILPVLIAATAAFLIYHVNLEYVESWLYDLRVRTTRARATSENIELIYITPNTIQNFKGLPTASDQNLLLENILKAGAKAVVYDFAVQESPGPDHDKIAWQNQILKSNKVFVASKETSFKGADQNLYLPYPLEKIKTFSAPKTADQLNFAKDGVTRRMILTYQETPLLPLHLATLFNSQISNAKSVRGQFDLFNTDQAYIDFHKPNSFHSTPFEKLLAKNFDFSRFHGKILLIGTDLNLNEEDYIRTPFNSNPNAMTRIEMQANILETLIQNSGPLRLPPYVDLILLSLIAFITIQIVLRMRPVIGLITLAGTVVGFTLVCFALFWSLRIWVPMAHPLLAVFMCYYFFIPYRLIIENRRSWEYYQRNKLLSQVEELKTNFISMMSHDLKTPIARIQGMTDVILAESTSINTTQKQAIDTIKQSADDLLKFINSILNYGRVESQGFQLHLQSRDINKLIQEVIHKHQFLAHAKQIEILAELEPMFPIQVDPELIKQVLSNLLENAIKYSPDQTKILVKSAEFEGQAVIQIADQGPGIPEDEISNIFMKFFRSKNAKSSPIKGSGLGLYLAKYFTELHHGKINVESIYGFGSTFTVELPMDQGGTNA